MAARKKAENPVECDHLNRVWNNDRTFCGDCGANL